MALSCVRLIIECVLTIDVVVVVVVVAFIIIIIFTVDVAHHLRETTMINDRAESLRSGSP